MRLSREKRLRAFLFGGVALSAIIASVVAYGVAFLQDFEAQTIDTRYSIRGSDGPPKDIVTVNVDTKTFNDLNLRWPFNCTLHARLLDRIRQAHPKAVIFDIQFSGYGTVGATSWASGSTPAP